LPLSHRNPFSCFKTLIVGFSNYGRKNNHATLVKSCNGLLPSIPIDEKYDDFGALDAAAQVKKMGL